MNRSIKTTGTIISRERVIAVIESIMGMQTAQIQSAYSTSLMKRTMDDAESQAIAYFYNSIGGSTKIRDIGILQSNNYAASKSVTSMKQLIKNTYIAQDDRKKIETFIHDLLEFYKGSSSVEFMGSWTSVFELILQLKVLSGDRRKRDPFAQEFFHNIKNYIDHELSFDFLDSKEIYSKKKSTVFKRLRKNLRERLKISISMALALDYRWKTSTSNQNSNIELARKFRKSNIFNHNFQWDAL